MLVTGKISQAVAGHRAPDALSGHTTVSVAGTGNRQDQSGGPDSSSSEKLCLFEGQLPSQVLVDGKITKVAAGYRLDVHG